MRKRIVSIITALALCLNLLPAMALAAPGLTVSIGGTALQSGKEYVAAPGGGVAERTDTTPNYIAYDANTAVLTVYGTVEITAAGMQVAGGTLTVTGAEKTALTLTDNRDQPTVHLENSTLTLADHVDFTATSSASAAAQGGAMDTVTDYTGSITLSNNSKGSVVQGVSLNLRTMGDITIQHTGSAEYPGSSYYAIEYTADSPATLSAKTVTVKSNISAAVKGDQLLTIIDTTKASISGYGSEPVVGKARFEYCGEVEVKENEYANMGVVVQELTSVECGSVTLVRTMASGSPFYDKVTSDKLVRLQDGVGTPLLVDADDDGSFYLYGGDITDTGITYSNSSEVPTWKTYYEAGEGSVRFLPMAYGAPARLTLNNATLHDDLNMWGVTTDLILTIEGSSRASYIGGMQNKDLLFTLAGSGELTFDTLAWGHVPAGLDKVRLNALVARYDTTSQAALVTAYGNARLIGMADDTFTVGSVAKGADGDGDYRLALAPGATLTIPDGLTLEVNRMDWLENNGSMVNNGIVKLTDNSVQDVKAAIRSLKLTGAGLVRAVNAGGQQTTYANNGSVCIEGTLNLTNAGTEGDLDANGYHWDNAANTLQLKDITLMDSVTLPAGDAVTIVTTEENFINDIAFAGGDAANVTFSGAARLLVGSIADTQASSLTVDTDTEVVVQRGGISLGSDADGKDAVVTVKGKLTANGDTPTLIKDGLRLNGGVYNRANLSRALVKNVPAVNVGQVVVGSGGVLTVSGAQGVQINGMSAPDGLLGAFQVEEGGQFIADCTDYNLMVRADGAAITAEQAEQIVKLPQGYLPDGYAVRLVNSADGSQQAVTIAPENAALTLYLGKLTGAAGQLSVTKQDAPNGGGDTPPSSGDVPDGGGDTPSGGNNGGNNSGATSGGGSNTGAATRAVSVGSSQNGTVTLSHKNAAPGTAVTITATPDKGYRLSGITVTDKNGKQLAVTRKSDSVYTFTIPAGEVEIKAVFEKADAETERPTLQFGDLDTGAWYYEAVDYVLQNGLMSGYGDGSFGPDDSLSRAMLAQILYNKEGKPAVSGTGSFADVPRGAWYAGAVSWASEKGIVSGYGDGGFGPDDPITREQLVVMLWRYQGSPAPTGTMPDFTDAQQISGYAKDAVTWAAENGIVSGNGGGVLVPSGIATRAQVAQMLKNFMENA